MRNVCLLFALVSMFAPAYALGDAGIAIRACIRNALAGERPFQTVKVSGQQTFVILLRCSNGTARSLYDGVRTISVESGPSINPDTGNEQIVRAFGDNTGPVPSQCVRVTRLANGDSANDFYCYIGVDLSSIAIQSLADLN